MSYIYIDNYVPAGTADKEFDRLWHTLDWERREDAPRLEYWQNNYDLPYTYGRGAGERTYEAKPWDIFVEGTMKRLNSKFGFNLDCCFINGYRDQRDALGWHADDSPEMDPNEPVISLSLGAERDIMLRDNMTRDIERVTLGHGSVLIMPAGFQQTHQHKIPKAGREVGPRISLTYRGLLV